MVAPSTPPSPSLPAAPANAQTIIQECRTLYLRELGQLLREAESLSGRPVEVFVEAVGAYFDEMVSGSRRSGFEDAKGLTASRITLVDENALELEIRLGNFSARLQETTAGDLWRAYLRFITLLQRPDMSTADNPVGPRGIALGLQELAPVLAEKPDSFLDRVDHLEAFFSQQLTVLYGAINDLFNRRGVQGAQPGIVTSPESAGATAAAIGGAGGSAGGNAAASLQASLISRAGGLPGGDIGSGGTGAAYGGGSGGGGGAVANLFSQAVIERLLERLEDFDRRGKPAPAPRSRAGMTTAGSGDASLESLIPGLFDSTPTPQPMVSNHRLLDAESLGLEKGAPEAITIDALALIFEAIFKSSDLPDAVKTALSSLQIPTLKAAMLDPSFFANDRQPARQLLDRMARAAIGLPPGSPSDTPPCPQLKSIAARLRSEYATDPGITERLIGELDTLITDRDSEIARAAADYLPHIAQLERRSQADARCRQIIDGFCARGIPPAIADFLRRHWQRVLLSVLLEQGEDSAAWIEHSGVIEQLLWSVQPKVEMDDRKQLAKLLPTMLQKLTAGMTRIKVPEDEKAAFMDACFALQTAALRGAAAPSPSATEEQAAKPAETPVPRILELQAGDRLLQVIEVDGAPGRLRPPACKVGDWLVFPLGEEQLCGRLCHIAPDSGFSLFLNPAWSYAVAIHPFVLDQTLGNGTARICSGDSLFNTAAEEALQKTVPL